MASHDQVRFDRLKEIFSSIPEGKKLLALAENNGCAIVFDPDLSINGKLDLRLRRISLNPHLDDEMALETLAHELRHLWQYCHLDPHRASSYSVPYIFVYFRMTEGDACAFADYFMTKLKTPDESINMKTSFYGYQPFMDVYDEKVLRHLKKLRSQISKGTFDRDSLVGIFNSIHAPAAPDEAILLIPAVGLSDTAPKYLDFKTVQELSDAILAHVPPETLKKAKKLMAGIKKSAGQAVGLIPTSA